MDEFTTHQGEQVGIGLQSFGRHYATILELAYAFSTLGIISLEIKHSLSVTSATFTHKDGSRRTIRWEDSLSQSLSQPGAECVHQDSDQAKPEDNWPGQEWSRR